MKKAIIFGNGWLGNLIKGYYKNNATVSGLNILDYKSIDGTLVSLKDHDVIINAAAKTNIDWIENNKYDAALTNIIGATQLAYLAKRHGKKYVFFSSACIFESKDLKDIKFEDSKPNPQCFYAETKAMAEQLVLQANPDALIIRPRLPLSEVPHPRNTINKLLSYEMINDNQESVTVVEDMLPILKDLIEKGEKGIFHMVNAGTISPAEIAGIFGHEFKAVKKAEQDERLAKEGRAKRVTTYVGSNRIELLPDIKTRIKSLAEVYQANVATKAHVK